MENKYYPFSFSKWQYHKCIKLTIKLITFIVQFSHNNDFTTYSVKQLTTVNDHYVGNPVTPKSLLKLTSQYTYILYVHEHYIACSP